MLLHDQRNDYDETQFQANRWYHDDYLFTDMILKAQKEIVTGSSILTK